VDRATVTADSEATPPRPNARPPPQPAEAPRPATRRGTSPLQEAGPPTPGASRTALRAARPAPQPRQPRSPTGTAPSERGDTRGNPTPKPQNFPSFPPHPPSCPIPTHPRPHSARHSRLAYRIPPSTDGNQQLQTETPHPAAPRPEESPPATLSQLGSPVRQEPPLWLHPAERSGRSASAQPTTTHPGHKS
jgi:hypothetical protein